MKKFLPLIIAAGAAAFFLLRRGTFARNLVYTFRGIALRGKLLKPEINILIGIQNPSNQRATIKSFVAVASWQGKPFANVSSFEKVEILPNTESRLTLKAQPSVFGMFTSVKDALKTGLKGGQINVKGTVLVDNVPVPVNITQNL